MGRWRGREVYDHGFGEIEVVVIRLKKLGGGVCDCEKYT